MIFIVYFIKNEVFVVVVVALVVVVVALVVVVIVESILSGDNRSFHHRVKR